MLPTSKWFINPRVLQEVRGPLNVERAQISDTPCILKEVGKDERKSLLG